MDADTFSTSRNACTLSRILEQHYGNKYGISPPLGNRQKRKRHTLQEMEQWASFDWVKHLALRITE